MERSAVMRMNTIAGGLSHQKPILFDRIEPSPPYIPFPKKTTIRDASFSAYLKPEESNQADDSEISIFDAQKYFNESSSGGGDPRSSKRVSPVHAHHVNLGRITESCDYSSVPRFSNASSSVDGYGRNYRARSFHATPTASSEASWNSQTGLLSNPPGAIAVSMRNPSSGDHDKKRMSASKWLLRTRCPCSGKKSVQVEDKQSETRTPSRPSQMSKVSLDLKKQIPASNGHNFSTPAMVPSSKWGRECVENGNERVVNLVTPDHWLENSEPVSATVRISAEHSRSFSSHHQVLAPGPARPFTDATNTSGGFTFPILTQTTTLARVRPPLLNNGLSSNNVISLEDPPRDSLEVFRPPEDPVPTKTTSTSTSTTELHRRQSFTFPASPTSRIIGATDDDMASDASSDLFEIESFSTQATSTHPMYSCMNRRDSLDEASNFNARRLTVTNGGSLYCCRRSLDEPMTPSVAATECYEPSEASIDWSVTTAEGFDRASVTNFSVTASEVAVDIETPAIRHRRDSEKNGGGGKKTKGGMMMNGGLLSCRCEKAVSVGPQPVKCVGVEGQRVGNSITKHVSSRPTTTAIATVNKPPLARSHSARLSLPFQP